MATENYTVVYIADAGRFVAGSRQVEQSLARIDLASARTKNGVSGVFGGAGRSATSAAKNVDKLAGSLNGVPAAATNAAKAVGQVGTALNNARRSSDHFGGSLVGYLNQVWALANKVDAILTTLGDKLAKVREFQDKGAATGLDMRDKAREVAGLLGESSPSDAVMNRIFRVQMAGGGTFDEALKYEEQFQGSLPAGKQAGHITDEQAAALETEGKAFADRAGIDSATAGDLVGSLPQFLDMTKDEKGKPLTTEQGVNKAMGQLNALHYGLNEGRGKISTLAANDLGASAGALANGRVADQAELGAFIGIGSNISKGAAGSGTTYDRLSRLLNEGLGEGGEFLKQIGVADQSGDLNKLRKLKEHVDAQRRASADPAKFDGIKYLQSKGFGNDMEVKSASGYMANLPQLEQRVTNARAKSKDGAGAIAANREFEASLEGQHRRSQATNEIGTYKQTETRQWLSAAREQAVGELRAEQKLDTSDDETANWVLDFISGPTRKWSGEQDSRAEGIDSRVRENLARQAKKAGIDIEAQHPGFNAGGYPIDAAMAEYGPKLSAAKVPFAGRNETIDAQIAAPPKPAAAKPPAGAPPKVAANRSGGGDLMTVASRAGEADDGSGLMQMPSVKAQMSGDSGVQPMPLRRQGGGDAGPDVVPAVGRGGGAGNQVASVDGSGLDKASGKLEQAAGVLMAAARAMSNGRPAPGGDFGGSYGPYRA